MKPSFLLGPLVALVLTIPATAAEPARPNVLLILADDLGFSDLGCYGGEIATPNLDALAKNGLRFTQFYNTARCWPTRACDPHRLLRPAGPPRHRARRQERRTRARGRRGPACCRSCSSRSAIARTTRANGTSTACRWQTASTARTASTTTTATSPHGSTPRTTSRCRRPSPKDGYYSSTAIADHAIKCLKEHADKHADQPFFEFLAFTAPHFPVQAPPEDVAKYRKTYLAGWDALREQRWQRHEGAEHGRRVAVAHRARRRPAVRVSRCDEEARPQRAEPPAAVERPDRRAAGVSGGQDGRPRGDGRSHGPRDRPRARPNQGDGGGWTTRWSSSCPTTAPVPRSWSAATATTRTPSAAPGRRS